jgi:hypothetical protein
MFRLFKKKIRWAVLIAAIASIASAQEAKKITSPILEEARKMSVSAATPKEEKTTVHYQILDSLLKDAKKKVYAEKYDDALLFVDTIKTFCTNAGLEHEIGNYTRKVILCFIDQGSHYRKKGDYKSSALAYEKGMQAAGIGEPRWKPRLNKILNELNSSKTVAMK